jgi:hypothetical protein
MKISRITILLAFVLTSTLTLAQGGNEVEMADVLRQDGKIYTVVFGLVVILTAMIILLIKVDRRVFQLEKDVKSKNN